MKIKYHPVLEPVGRATPDWYVPALVMVWVLYFTWQPMVQRIRESRIEKVEPVSKSYNLTEQLTEVLQWREFLDGTELKVMGLPDFEPMPRDQFINETMRASTNPNPDFSAISAVCDATTWRNDLVFRCGLIDSEIGSGRNQFLTCLRFAIKLGAGVILPGVQMPEEKREPEELSTMFDVEAFSRNIRIACPQLSVFVGRKQIAKLGYAWELASIKLDELKADKHHGKVLKDPVAWQEEFDGWLEVATRDGTKNLRKRDEMPTDIEQSTAVSDFIPSATATAQVEEEELRIRIIEIEPLPPMWPICHDGEEFANNFGRLLSMPIVIQELTASILYRISTYFQIPLDARRPIFQGTFLALTMSWKDDEDFTNKLRRYVGVSRREGLPILYALTNSRDDLDYLWDRSYPRNTVWKKWFVTPEELKTLERLPAHSRILLDYMVAERAAYYWGLDSSIFSWTIAASRRRAGRLAFTCPDFAVKPPKGVAFVDDWSELYGTLEGHEEMAMAVWP